MSLAQTGNDFGLMASESTPSNNGVFRSLVRTVGSRNDFLLYPQAAPLVQVSRMRSIRKEKTWDQSLELTRIIGELLASFVLLDLVNPNDQGYLTVTRVDGWALVLGLCDRASTSESDAKEILEVLRTGFKCVKLIGHPYSI